MDRHHVQQVCPFFATRFSLHEHSRDSPFNMFRVWVGFKTHCHVREIELFMIGWSDPMDLGNRIVGPTWSSSPVSERSVITIIYRICIDRCIISVVPDRFE